MVPKLKVVDASHNHYTRRRLPIIVGRDSQVCTGKISGGDKMLWTLFVVLLVLWLLGVVSSYTLGGFIHILLVLAVIALVFQLISGRRTAV
jgi:hypothetical protein